MTTGTDLHALQRRLEARAAALRTELAPPSGRPADATGREVTDHKDEAERELRSVVADAEGDRDRDELAAIADALRRIAQGRYGRCTDCDEPIGLDRLQAQPEAARCIACQRKAEAHGPAARLA